jgi:hypothetical protein
MPRRKLALVLLDFEKSIRESKKLKEVIMEHHQAGHRPNLRRLQSQQVNLTIAMAFIHSFRAWESMLEQSFVLYMLGKSAPTMPLPHRYVMPPSRSHAILILKRQREFLSWSNHHAVRTLANCYFRDGYPYEAAFGLVPSLLNEVKTIRNAIAHKSEDTKLKFLKLARDELGTIPPTMTPGGFLQHQKLNHPAQPTYFDYYLDGLLFVANNIIY